MHINKVNNKKYIGQTCQDPQKRWMGGLGYIESPRFYNAIKKYGWDNFEHIIVQDNLTLNEANVLEESLIAEFNTTSDEFGYNLQSGGMNKLHSEETKQKIKIAHTGFRHTEESKKKMSDSKKGEKSVWYGRRHTEEEKSKISKKVSGENNGMYGKTGSSNPFYGKHHTEEVKNKLSKKVCQYSIDGEFIKIWDSIKQAEDYLNIYHISDCCNGKRKTAGGFVWKYFIE